MTPKDIAHGMMRGIVNENVVIYRELFEGTAAQAATDPYWQRALALFESLGDEQRNVFFEIVRQVSVDTTSNILGVLDGINPVRGIEAGIVVSDTKGNRLNGDLQSLFLVEDEGKAS